MTLPYVVATYIALLVVSVQQNNLQELYLASAASVFPINSVLAVSLFVTFIRFWLFFLNKNLLLLMRLAGVCILHQKSQIIAYKGFKHTYTTSMLFNT